MQNIDIFHPQQSHKELRELTSNFAKKEMDAQAREFDEKEEFNIELFRKIGKELGLFGITVPESKGGHGLDATAAVIVHEEMSKYDPAFTLSYLAHEELFVNNLCHSGNEKQIAKYLPKCLNGEWIAGMAMSEPDAGTDVLGMKTTARKEGEFYILNGSKQWITNGPYGDVFLVYAKKEKDSRKVSAFIVEKNFPGFSIGKKEKKMGMKASPTSELVFEDCKVPLENLIGEEENALLYMMRNLEIERLTLAAQSLGIAGRAMDIMQSYAAERIAFGKPLYKFGQIQRMIAESYASLQAARTLVYNTALRISPDKRNSLDAAASKLIATTMAETVVRNAIQVLGGYGYTRDYPLERLLRDAILLSIGGGTNEAMQKNIASDLHRELL